jgi:hypothetical protein
MAVTHTITDPMMDEILEEIMNIHNVTSSKIKTSVNQHYCVIFPVGEIEWGGLLALGRSTSLLNDATKSIHAEHDAMKKLNKINKFKRFLNEGDKIDMLVVRMSKSGITGYSRPCRNCLLRLEKSKYQINRIYYTVDEESITCEKFGEMYDSPLTKLSSGDRKKD